MIFCDKTSPAQKAKNRFLPSSPQIIDAAIDGSIRICMRHVQFLLADAIPKVEEINSRDTNRKTQRLVQIRHSFQP
jgi:hypothetical protein